MRSSLWRSLAHVSSLPIYVGRAARAVKHWEPIRVESSSLCTSRSSEVCCRPFFFFMKKGWHLSVCMCMCVLGGRSLGHQPYNHTHYLAPPSPLIAFYSSCEPTFNKLKRPFGRTISTPPALFELLSMFGHYLLYRLMFHLFANCQVDGVHTFNSIWIIQIIGPFFYVGKTYLLLR